MATENGDITSRLVSLIFTVLVGGILALPGEAESSRFERQVETSYRQLWRQLDETAERTIARLDTPILPEDDPLRIFQILDAEAEAGPAVGTTLLLLDARAQVFAWGGQGLLHEIEALPRGTPGGRFHYASFSAATLLTVRSLELGGSQWHVVAGLSLRTNRFPFARHVGDAPRWTLVSPGAGVAEGALRVTADNGPELVVEPMAVDAKGRRGVLPAVWRHAALMILAVFLVVLAWIWIVPGKLGTRRSSQQPVGTSRSVTLVLGGAAAMATPTVALIMSRVGRLPDMGSDLLSTPGDLIGRIALVLLVWGLLSAVREAPPKNGHSRSRALGISLLALALAAICHDWVIPSLALLFVAGMGLALWRRRQDPSEVAATMAMLGLASTLLAATGWEVGHRWDQKQEIRDRFLPAMAPPSADEIESLADEMQSFLGSQNVEALTPSGIEGVARHDLAFEIWQHSPLAKYGGLSALRILPRDGGVSSFSFGLPLNEESWVDWASPLWGSAPVPEWEDAVLVGDGELQLAGEPWAYAEYALALQPGFRLRTGLEEDLAEVLLRTGPTHGEPNLSDLGGALYGLYGTEGQPIVAPWPQSPRLPAALLMGGESRLGTPDGPSFAYSAVGSDGVRVLFLRQLSPILALERVGAHALPPLVVLAIGMLLLQVPRVARQGFRVAWYHLWHSYSRRLMVVYSILVLVPLVLINYLVVRAFEERLVREQAAAGLLAVESAQGVLGEYVLALKPGFGIDAALDDGVLFWLSSVVHHDVNLYWRGLVYASSKAELFTAGLLPRRIPGEIYSRLTLLRHQVSMRTNQAGRAEYLELYAPLTVPGVSFGQTRLIVSLPLLAQQEETAGQIASLRRRSLLGTAAMVLLIVAVGIRLARRFTAPLTAIVQGTQRIAAGDPALNLRPVELELATLVDAIDDMAARIHAGRQELLREKSLVDRMVENITAGVISLDEKRRVLMANRVAGQLTGLQVGQELDAVVEQDQRLAPLAAFLARVPPEDLGQETVVLKDAGGEEEEWTLVWVPLPGQGEPSALLVLEDVTEVLRGQRLQAWAEMARMIAHEIKNPLTPIRLSAEHMREIFGSDPENFAEVFESCTANILRQVGELQEIAGDFSTYSRIPKIEPRRGDLVEVVQKVVVGYRKAPAGGSKVELEAQEKVLDASFDAKLVSRAVRNLIENALRAVPNGGQVTVSVSRDDGGSRIVVADNGPGVREGLLQKIFDPYFSTHDTGTGLGLPIARQIAEEHGGSITARNRPTGGLEVTITLPQEPTR